MGKPYSSDLRERVQKHVEACHTRRASARRFGVSSSFAVKLNQRARAMGSTAPARQGRPPGSSTMSAFRGYLMGQVEAQPDITLREIGRGASDRAWPPDAPIVDFAAAECCWVLI